MSSHRYFNDLMRCLRMNAEPKYLNQSTIFNRCKKIKVKKYDINQICDISGTVKDTLTNSAKLGFADDTAIGNNGYTTREANNNLQKSLDKASEYCSRWKIKLNSGKSQHTVFSYTGGRIHL